MEVAFRTKRLRTICEDEEEASRSLDLAVVDQLVSRLADLRAADSLADLIAGNPVLSDDQTTVTIDLTKGYAIQLQVNHHALPIDSDGKLQRENVRRFQVIDIGESP